MGLGHEEAGRKYRIKAKDLIIAALGGYPETGSTQEAKVPAGAVVRPRRSQYP
jgi:hypothetical protein